MVDAPRCEFPGCTRPSRSETGTGRPPKYCEEADPAGGPVHNRLNAYRLRQARPRAVDVAEASPGTVRPVSIATMGLEQAIAGFLAGADALATQLTAVTTHVRTASDLDAAVAEVEDTRREADLKIGEAGAGVGRRTRSPSCRGSCRRRGERSRQRRGRGRGRTG